MNIEDFLQSKSSEEEEKAKHSQSQHDKAVSKPNQQIFFEKKESVKKEKKIKKRQRKKKPKIYCKETVKKGRPKNLKKDESFSISEDETQPIKVSFMNYMERVGLVKGLVFKPCFRQRLQTEQKKKQVYSQINWKNKHQWNKINEQIKIEEKLNMLSKQTDGNFDYLKNTFLDIGEIFADQTTSEIYDFLIGIIMGILEGKSYLEQLYASSIFLTGKFTNLVDKHQCPLIRDEERMKTAYSLCYEKVKTQMQAILQTKAK